MDYTPDKNALLKAQWDLIHNPENVQFAWTEEMEEGAMINIFSLIDDIRKANSNEERILTVTQDKCPSGHFKDVKLGDNKLSLLQINCTSDFENAKIDETITSSWREWKPKLGSKIAIKPMEKVQVFAESNYGKVVYYQFHELKTEPAPTEELTDNLMFEFAVLEKEKNIFEDYLYPKSLIRVEGISYLSQMDKEDTKSKTGCTSGCCQAASVWMIEQKGVSVNHSNRIYFEDPINTLDLTNGITPTLSEKEFNETISYIKNSLKNQRPVLFGTWDNRTKEDYIKGGLGPEAWNNKLNGTDNSPTTHFMVIMEYGFDKTQNKYYIRFYDPGRSSFTDGTSEQNRLYIDTESREILGTYRNKTYKVTEIRKNL